MSTVIGSSVLPVVCQSTDELLNWRCEQQTALQKMADDNVTVDASNQLVPTAFFWAYQGLNDVEIMRLRGTIIRGNASSIGPGKSRSAGNPDHRLRVGFLSAYFRNHTIGRLNIGRIEQLDRTQFHVTVCSAFSGEDEFTSRFRKAADRYVTVDRDVKSAIETLRRLELDVLVFADVGMDALTSTLAFSRLAPVQCVTWGHPETTGSDAMDCFLSSELLDDESSQAHYSEALIRMPLTGTYYERPVMAPLPVNVRSDLGLPDDRHLYACPQSLFKCHPDDDVVLGGILEADRRGVVVMIEGRVPEWTARLRSRWQKTLADVQDRIIFLPVLPHEDYLRLLQISDVVLDPLHFGGGNSSYEALAMGTPVVTMPSRFLRGRITHALYRKMQLNDCVVSSTSEYISLAVRLAGDSEFRREIQSKINATSGILFEDPAEVRCLEQALKSVAW